MDTPAPSVDLRRVVVYGVTGCGKTTLARRIAESTGLPVHAVDDEIGWLPGWTERPRDEQRRLAAAIVATDRWVLDTAYSHWRDLVVPRADLIVALDYPRWRSLTRLVRRTARRLITREPVCNGNTETWRQQLSRDSIIAWHFRSFRGKRDQIDVWEANGDGPRLVRLRSPREADRWLGALRTNSF